jgi:hypothetical protein
MAMFNTLEMVGLAQYGFGNQDDLALRREAAIAFEEALQRGKWRGLWRKLLGKDSALRSLGRINAQTTRQPARGEGVVSVPLAHIVGSEGRVGDFDNAFNPLNDNTRGRWINIAAAMRDGVTMPPVELIQAADGYYVRDGHHRISVARAAGQAVIEARIAYVLG